MTAAVTLYRPVGLTELALIEDSGMRRFPPRMPEQPVFYPVLGREYAAEIAENWNTREPYYFGAVTTFHIDGDYASRFEPQTVGADHHQEFWVPADELPEFNAHIIGPIGVTDVFYGKQYSGPRFTAEEAGHPSTRRNGELP